MATPQLVTQRVEKGKRLVQALFQEKLAPRSAFWRYLPEPGEWRLFIVIPKLELEGPRWGYNAIQRALKKHGLADELPLRQIAVVGTSDPTAVLLQNTFRTQTAIIQGQPELQDAVLDEDTVAYRTS